jgi:hypothetical protein
MRDKIISLTGWMRENAGALSAAHSLSTSYIQTIEWDDVPDDAVAYGQLTVWVKGRRLLAGVWTGTEWVTHRDGRGPVRDITSAIHRVDGP